MEQQKQQTEKQDKTCRFRISEIADLMGLSVSGVIYLEKKGAVKPLREENGYRYYSEDTVSRLGLVRSFEHVGFSLNEALALLETEPEDMLAGLKEKKQQMLESIEKIDMLTKMMETASLRKGIIEEMVSPAFRFFPYWEKYYDAETMPKAERDRLRRVDVSWLGAIPVVCYGDRGTLTENGGKWQKGMFVEQEEAEQLGLVMHPLAEIIPARRCLHLFTEAKRKTVLEKLQTHASETGLKLSAPVMALIRQMKNSGDGLEGILWEYYVPVEPV